MSQPRAFGKYQLLEKIAVGGMAEIYRAKYFGAAGFEKVMVVKQILPQYAQDPDFVKMFIDEAKIAVSLSHGNIVPVYELGKIDGVYFIAMEHIDGKNLGEVMERAAERKRPLPTQLALHVAMEICKGLDYAHRKQAADGTPLHIVHRDISPQNVLLSYDGEVKIVDFGIAKAIYSTQTTKAGVIKGKFAYMSPEQARGQTLDSRSDVFSTGTLLFEMLTGGRLFGSDSEVQTLENVKAANVPTPSRLNPKILPLLDKIVFKALAKEPDDRYQTADDLQKALMKFLYSQGWDASTNALSAYMGEVFPQETRNRREIVGDAQTTGAHAQMASTDRAVVPTGGPDPDAETPIPRSAMQDEATRRVPVSELEPRAKAASAPIPPPPAPSARPSQPLPAPPIAPSTSRAPSAPIPAIAKTPVLAPSELAASRAEDTTTDVRPKPPSRPLPRPPGPPAAEPVTPAVSAPIVAPVPALVAAPLPTPVVAPVAAPVAVSRPAPTPSPEPRPAKPEAAPVSQQEEKPKAEKQDDIDLKGAEALLMGGASSGDGGRRTREPVPAPGYSDSPPPRQRSFAVPILIIALLAMGGIIFMLLQKGGFSLSPAEKKKKAEEETKRLLEERDKNQPVYGRVEFFVEPEAVEFVWNGQKHPESPTKHVQITDLDIKAVYKARLEVPKKPGETAMMWYPKEFTITQNDWKVVEGLHIYRQHVTIDPTPENKEALDRIEKDKKEKEEWERREKRGKKKRKGGDE